MAANTKYQPVAARDSFEEGERSMPPPPSYQEESGVPGEARTEDDNIPDDFKVRRTTTSHCNIAAAILIETSHSSAAPSQKPPCPSACSSSVKSTPF